MGGQDAQASPATWSLQAAQERLSALLTQSKRNLDHLKYITSIKKYMYPALVGGSVIGTRLFAFWADDEDEVSECGLRREGKRRERSKIS